MPKRISGVSTRLLECAKEEFLNKGFQNASIRSIAEKANTSARAVYTRFPDKEGLFISIVGSVADEFIRLFQDYSDSFWVKQNENPEVPTFSTESSEPYILMIHYVYDHIDEFNLILKFSEGTRFSDFVEQLTLINCAKLEDYQNYFEEPISDYEPTMKLIHMLTHSFYAGFFEPVFHNMNREEAIFFVGKLYKVFSFGISNLL